MNKKHACLNESMSTTLVVQLMYRENTSEKCYLMVRHFFTLYSK